MLKRLHGKKGPIVLYERKRQIECHDEWRNDGKYVMEYTVQLIWNKVMSVPSLTALQIRWQHRLQAMPAENWKWVRK